MQASDALQRVLTDHTPLYAGERVPVRFAEQPHYAGEEVGGPYLAVNPDINGWYQPDPPVSGANEIRLLRDTLSHEGYEYRMGHPTAKRAFMMRFGDLRVGAAGRILDDSDFPLSDRDRQNVFPTPKARFAGTVYNILRDAWVNSTRCRTYPGLRRTFAFKADLLAGGDDISELPLEQALAAGLHQVALTNTAEGITEAPEGVRRLLAWARGHVEACRRATTHAEILAAADAVTEVYLSAMPEDLDEAFEDLLEMLDDMTMGAEVADMDPEDVADAINDGRIQLDLDPAPGDEGDGEGEDGDGDGPSIAIDGLDTESEDGEGGAGGEPDVTVDADDLDDGVRQDLEDALGSGDQGGEDGEEADAGGGPGDDAEGDHGDAGSPEGGRGGEPRADDGADGGGGDTEVDRTLDDMDRLDDGDRKAGDYLGLDDGDDYHEPDAGDVARYEQVRKEVAFGTTDWASRMENRDDYERPETLEGDLDAEEIQELMRRSGLAEDLRRAFARIKTREVRRPTKRPTKRLHLKNVVRHMAGDYGERRVYQETKRGASGGRTICAVLDGSGSMDAHGSIGREYAPEDASKKWGAGAIVDAKVVLAALHIATREIGDRLVANGFDSGASDDVRLVTGPDETFGWDHLDGMSGAGGSTPTAAGVMDGIGLLERAGGSDRVMVVITDGGANRGLNKVRKWETYHTGDRVKDVRYAVELAREEGIQVIGIGVGTGVSEGEMAAQFGPESWIHVEAADLVDEVVRIYREQLDDDRVADSAW